MGGVFSESLPVAVADKTWKVIGPPGTGKTTFVARQMAKAAHKLRDGRVVLASSLTRGAAAELASRGGLSEASQVRVGTLHSHALKSLGGQVEVLGASHAKEWNSQYGKAEWRLETDRSEDKSGSAVSRYHIARARLTPRETWSLVLTEFAEAYENFKSEQGLLDFSDLIDEAYRWSDCGPGVPQFMFVDEAQDHDSAQFRLIMKWAARPEVEKLVIVGDALQALYAFRGSEAEAFDSIECPADQRIVLSQSYRVPRCVHGVAAYIAQQIDDCQIDPWKPRDAEGLFSRPHAAFTCKHFGHEISTRALLAHPGKSILFLTTCRYMLTPLIFDLREAGIPYHNPLARADRGWNPLYSPPRGRSTVQRFLSFISADDELWTASELLDWSELVKTTGVFRRGWKNVLKRIDTEDVRQLETLFEDGVLDAIAQRPIRWLVDHVKDSKAKHLAYIVRVYQEYGPKGLTDTPRIAVGTIHSTKGGEFDVVYLSPKLSAKEQDQLMFEPNEIHRKFYVGVTRAREELHVVESQYGEYHYI